MPTPAVRQLEREGIAHRVVTYQHDPAHESYGLEAASALGVDAASVFKTLVVEVDGAELVVAILPVDARLDLKAVARTAGAKRAAMAPTAAAERATGYVIGGISPFGQRKKLATLLDESALVWDEIHVSGGRRGMEIVVSPHALLAVLDASVAALSA